MTSYTSASEDLLSFKIKQALGEVDDAVMVLKNFENEYGGLTTYTAFDISYGTAKLFAGRIDKPTPSVAMVPDVLTQVMEVIGRNHARNLFGIAIEESFDYQEALIIVESLIAECPLITYTYDSENPSGTTMSLPANLGFVGGYLQYILNERLGHDYYVDVDGALQEFAIGTVDTGITLQSIGNSADNNLLEFIWDKNDITEVKNYIILKGGKLRDHWTEGNASDWTTNATSVLDESEFVSMGVQSLICTCGEVSDPYIELDIYNSGDGLYSYDSLDFNGVINGELNFDVLLSSGAGISMFGDIFVSLQDEKGNVLTQKMGTAVLENLYGNFVGLSFSVGPAARISKYGPARNMWWYSTFVEDEFTWNVRKIRIGLVGWDSISRPDAFIIDNLAMPVLVRSIAQDTNSQTANGLVMDPQETSLKSQVEMDASSAMKLAANKDPKKLATMLAVGTAGIDGSTNNWKIGGTFTLNHPPEDIDEESWRILSMIHNYDKNNPVKGHSYTVELTAVPNSQVTDINTSQSKSNSAYLLKELRQQIAAIEQQEAINSARIPALPAPLGDLYLLDDTLMYARWFFHKLPFTLVDGTTKEADADAAGEYVIQRLTGADTGPMWDCDDIDTPEKTKGKVYFYFRMKVSDVTETDPVLVITFVENSVTLKTATVYPDYFDTNDEFKTFGVATNFNGGYPIQIEGAFTTGRGTVSMDWVGSSSFAVPTGTSGLSVNTQTLDIDPDNAGMEIDVTGRTIALVVDEEEIDLIVDEEGVDIIPGASANHTHSLTNTAGYVVASTSSKFALSASTISTKYAISASASSLLYAASSSGGSPTTQFLALGAGSSLVAFKAIPTATAIQSFISVESISGLNYIATGTATITDGAHNHVMSDSKHVHTQTADGHPHTQSNDSHNHPQDNVDHTHPMSADAGHNHVIIDGASDRGHEH